VPGALVQVGSGTLAGRTTTSDAAGQFRFDEPVSAREATTLTVLAAGYPPTTVIVDRTAVTITLGKPLRFAIEGDKALTVGVADECTSIPSRVRRRSYPSTIIAVRQTTQSSDEGFYVELSASEFFTGLRTISLGVRGNRATMSISSVEAMTRWLDDLPVYARLNTAEYLAVHGTTATTTLNAADTEWATTFDGTVTYCAKYTDPVGPGFPPGCAVPPIECRSS
jgi:hypothetical protein